MKTRLALVAAAVVLASCGPIVKSVPIDKTTGYPVVEPPSNGAQGEKNTSTSGAIYFLPKSYFKIKVAPKPDGDDKSQKKENANIKNKATIQNNVTVTVQGTAAADGKGSASATGHDIELEFMRSDFDNKPFTFTLDVVTKIDPQQVYYLQYLPSAASEDDIDITVKDFFISSVKTTAENKSDEIALKTVELIKQAVLLGTGIPAPLPSTAPAANVAKSTTDKSEQNKQASEERSALCPESIDIEIDPVDIIKNPIKNREYAGCQCYTSEETSCLPRAINLKLERLAFAPGETQDTGNHGVHYRAAFPYRLTISVGGKAGVTKVVERIVLLPNESPAYLFDLRRTALVKKTYDVKFENGFLTSAKINKPSELLAGVSLPVDIIKSVASIPAEIIQLKVNYNSQQQAVLDAQKARFDSLKAFNDAVLEMYKTNAAQTQTLIEQLKK